MEKNIRVLKLLQRRFKRLHQVGRQFADKADSIGEENLLTRGEGKTSGGWVKCIEKPVIGRDRRLGQCVKQRGLARIGISDECHERKAVFEPQAALGAPLFPYF